MSHVARGLGGPGRTGGGRNKCGRVATRLAMPCDADSNQILSRSRVDASLVQGRAWVRVGPEGQVVSQQWLAHTTAPGVQPQDRRRPDLVVYGATTRGGALCCDVTLVSPPTRTGHPQPCRLQSVAGTQSMEPWGPALRPRPGPLAGPARASRRQGRRRVRMGDDGGAPDQWRCSSRLQALP